MLLPVNACGPTEFLRDQKTSNKFYILLFYTVKCLLGNVLKLDV